MRLDYKPSPRFAEYMRLIKCDQWESTGEATSDRAFIRHISGLVLSYALHDGGNDRNSPRNFAKQVQDACGCILVQPRGRKRSRKAFRPSGFRLDDHRDSAASIEIAGLVEEHGAQRREWEALVANPCRSSATRARVRCSTKSTRPSNDFAHSISL